MSRQAMQSDVGEFIAARSDQLLRTAYLLSGDRDEAERLLQAALAAVWASWSRSELGPDLTARRELVRGMGPWWRPRPRTSPEEDEVLAALDRLPRRQRAALVLAEVDGLSVAELSVVLDCPPLSAGRLVERARTAFSVADPRALLEAAAERIETGTTVAQRLGHVERRVGRRRRWRRAEVLGALGLVAVVALVVAVLMPNGNERAPSPPPKLLPRMVRPPPVLEGQRLPPLLPINGVNYQYDHSAQSLPGDRVFREVVRADNLSQALAWVTPPTTHGPITVSVDGDVVSRTKPGRFASGVLLPAYGSHVVVMRGSPLPGTRLGLAVYRYPSTQSAAPQR